MADTVEIVLTSDSSDQLWNACVWDPRAGTTLMTYKGGSASPHTLCLLGNDYLLAAEPNKPIIRSWALNKHEQVSLY
jgi:pre-rRNA-processing protein IPI3